MGYPNTSSAVVQPNPLGRVHGLTRCEPTPAPNPRVELSLTRTAAHPYQMSESEMGLTLPDSSLLTRGAGHPYPMPGLEMSPTRVVGKPPFMVTEVGLAPRVASECENHLGLLSDSLAGLPTHVTHASVTAAIHEL